MNNYDYLFKLILIGDSSVGKSCLLTRLIDEYFKSECDPTIGIEFGTKIIKSSSGVPIWLQIWDTAGQENFWSITQSYYKGAIGALIIFDISNWQSFDNLSKWIRDAKTSSNSENFELVILGNKHDLIQSRKVTKEEAKTFAA